MLIQYYSLLQASTEKDKSIAVVVKEQLLKLLKNLLVTDGYYIFVSNKEILNYYNVEAKAVKKVLLKGGYKRQDGSTHRWGAYLVDDVPSAIKSVLSRIPVSNTKLNRPTTNTIPVVVHNDNKLRILQGYHYSNNTITQAKLEYINSDRANMNTYMYLADNVIKNMPLENMTSSYANIEIQTMYVAKYGLPDGLMRFYKRSLELMYFKQEIQYKQINFHYGK